MTQEEIIAKLMADSDEKERQLAELVAGIREARARRANVVVGRLLWKAKGIVPHGQWRMWLNEVGLPYRYAVDCIQHWRNDRRLGQAMPLRSTADERRRATR
jgi:hypothetical protein